jgi:prepilin-type N-terminal cleavage/methylation domain-containing protein
MRIQKNIKDDKGFTLVELLVSMAVFGILMALAIGVFVSATQAQRKLTSLMTTNNNLNLILEQMSREIRMGYFDYDQFKAIEGSLLACRGNISFRTMKTDDPKKEGEIVTYSFAGQSILKDGVKITGEDVNVERLCFFVYQYKKSSNPSIDLQNNCNPWRVGITLAVKPKNAKPDDPKTFIETTVSMRVLPIEINDDPFHCRRPE